MGDLEWEEVLRTIEITVKQQDQEIARLQKLVERHGPCICDTNPDTTSGPDEWCPQHGRPYTDALDYMDRAVADLMENPRDNHHTMEELYEYRMLYNALLFREWRDNPPDPEVSVVVKSWKHSDGEPCFGGGWFIVVADTPAGQISHHYKAEHWDLFDIPEVEIPPAYDGHTPADVAQRLRALLEDR